MNEAQELIDGDEEIYQLVYVSAATVQFAPDDLSELLDTARTNNASLGVTGLLLFIDGTFFQVLEGDQEQVQSLYEKSSSMIAMTKRLY